MLAGSQQVTELADQGLKALDESRLPEAAEYLDGALALARTLGDAAREADVLAILGLLALRRGQAEPARGHLLEAIRLARSAGDQLTEKLALERLATVAAFQGDMSAAQDLLAAALGLARTLGDRQHEADLLWHSAILHAEAGEHDRAVERGHSAITLLESLKKPQARIYAEHLEKFSAAQGRLSLRESNATFAERKATMPPSLLRMAISATRALGQFAGSGLKIVDAQTHEQRMDACRACRHFTGMRCRACGCFAHLKARLPHEDCPLGKWPKVAGTVPVPSAEVAANPEGSQPLAGGQRSATTGYEPTRIESDPGGVTAPFRFDPSGVEGIDTPDNPGCAAQSGANGFHPSGMRPCGVPPPMPANRQRERRPRTAKSQQSRRLARPLGFENLEARSLLSASSFSFAARALLGPPAPHAAFATTFDTNSPLMLDNAAGKSVDIALDSNTLVVAAATWCPHCHDFINWLREPAVQADVAGLKVVFAFGDESAAGNGPIYDPSWLVNDPGQVVFIDANSAAEPTSYPEIYDTKSGGFSAQTDPYQWINSWLAGQGRAPIADLPAEAASATSVPATFDLNSPLKLDDAAGNPVNITLDANTLVVGAATWCMHCHDFINWLREPDVQAEVSGLNVVFAFGDESAMGYGKIYDPSWLLNDPGQVAFLDPSSTARPTAFPEIYDPVLGQFSEGESPYQWINTWLVDQGRPAISDVPAEAVSAASPLLSSPAEGQPNGAAGQPTPVTGPIIADGQSVPAQTIYVTAVDDFITTNTVYPPIGNTFNGVNGADWTCTNEASNAGLIPGWDGLTIIYHALVSTNSESASSHIDLQGELQNYAGQVVATSSANLWSGSLANAVLYDFGGNLVSSSKNVLTGSSPSGGYISESCGSLNSKLGVATKGIATSTDSSWVASGSTASCNAAFRLYCVSPPPLPTTIGTGTNVVPLYDNQYPTDDTVTISGGSLDLNGLPQTLAGITIDSGSLLDSVGGGNLSVTGSILTQTATVSANLSGAATFTEDTVGATTLSGANTYTGGTIASGGTLTIATSASLPSGYPLTVNAGTVNIGSTSGVSVNVSTLTVNGGTLAHGTLTATSIIVSSGTISSNLAGSGGLVEQGSGSVTLSGSNSYSGGTKVLSGTLIVTTANSLPTGSSLTVGAWPS